jgi:cyclic beta-1,2-glucan synthetase
MPANVDVENKMENSPREEKAVNQTTQDRVTEDRPAEDRLKEDRLTDFETERASGEKVAAQLAWVPSIKSSDTLVKRCSQLRSKLAPVMTAVNPPVAQPPLSEDQRLLRDNESLMYSELDIISGEFASHRRLPHVHVPEEEVLPRTLALAQRFLKESGNRFSEQAFASFCLGFQKISPLELREFKALAGSLKLALLEEIAEHGTRLVIRPASESQNQSESQALSTCIQSLREASQLLWKDTLESLVPFDQILQQDPTGTYPAMEFDSRDLYRTKIAAIAEHSDLTEMEVAHKALELAQKAQKRAYRDSRIALRESHIGYYLSAEGIRDLSEQVGYRPTIVGKLRTWLRQHPDEFFVPGITLFTCAIITAVLLLITSPDSSLSLILLSLLLFLLPSSQCAVQLMDYVITALLTPEILPKLDFSKAVPDDCLTLVAIPTLLLNEKQVRGLVEDLEVRFLGNHDPNIHFALVSDLPDAHHQAREDSTLIDLCGSLIHELNEKYASQKKGSFLLLHRHRVYNPREKRWMGWERKRGKLLDLNRLLRGQYDSFPVKVGDLSILPKVRFVITLDSDTELPRGSAHRMIGAMAHPLNQAIVNPEKNIVVAGYGILQPRVGVSVQSTVRSRLAAIYAGETGLDIYTRAVSDAYQDLYGEGIFTGKGIYEVDTVHRVLGNRFPSNALLSHDLIEGAYARAGLATDMEVIEDYPSHYSAYNRRKHRWLRGDWQISGWLSSQVRDQSGALVDNPISLISRWKIFDNLRRSLVEPATFVLLMFAWLAPGVSAIAWTVAAVFLLFLPAWFQLAFGLGRALVQDKPGVAREAVRTFLATNFTTLLTLVFLAHQTLLSLDAVIRAVVRRAFTRERLLEWETAAEAELNTRLTPVDLYLNWMPILSIAIGFLVWTVRPRSLYAAAPVLLLWACSKMVSTWLNRPPVVPQKEFPRKDLLFLRSAALHTWRYFAEHCTEEHNWLIPDNVQQEPAAVAARVSPTNLGLLFNAQQVACEFGYITVPELAVQVQRTLATLSRLPKYQGHMLNWYETRTLNPLPHRFVSSVDSGNLLASLWTLQQGCLALLQEPLVDTRLAEGLLDHLRALVRLEAYPRKQISQWEKDVKTEEGLLNIFALGETIAEDIKPTSASGDEADLKWFREQTALRIQSIRDLAQAYMPWELPDFKSLRDDEIVGPKFKEHPKLLRLPEFVDDLQKRLERALLSVAEDSKPQYVALQRLLPQAQANAIQLAEKLRIAAAEAGKLAEAMDFGFLLNPRRKLLSVGFNLQTNQLEPAAYDLLASEARIAAFVAIAKEDVAQECWFHMGRPHTVTQGSPILMSWTGTMFEYLMPTLFMRSYPNTMLDRSRTAVIVCQQEYASRKGVPWGISESGFAKLDAENQYGYQAFGIPYLALMKYESHPLVISPYSTFLALTSDPSAVLRNLRRMDRLGWFGPCGFYEAADYGTSDRGRWSGCQIVREWMAHHQGMTLLALANFLGDHVVQRWFHSSRRVQATELLLHEKPVSHVRRRLMGVNAA